MIEIVDGWEREEIKPKLAGLMYGAVYTKGDGFDRVIWVDRILVDRWGDEWRRREERRLLRDPNAKAHEYSGQSVAPSGDPQ